MVDAITNYLLLIVSLFLSTESILIGSLLFFKPSRAIELQRRFYEKINWRMEPINLPRELKSTKFMGLLLFVVGIATVVYILSAKPF
jgi:hypothetical protein